MSIVATAPRQPHTVICYVDNLSGMAQFKPLLQLETVMPFFATKHYILCMFQIIPGKPNSYQVCQVIYSAVAQCVTSTSSVHVSINGNQFWKLTPCSRCTCKTVFTVLEPTQKMVWMALFHSGIVQRNGSAVWIYTARSLWQKVCKCAFVIHVVVSCNVIVWYLLVKNSRTLYS